MSGIYRPRHPERTVLYRVLFYHFGRFLTEYESRFEREYGFFRQIVKEVVKRSLDCGNRRCGFARIRCLSKVIENFPFSVIEYLLPPSFMQLPLRLADELRHFFFFPLSSFAQDVFKPSPVIYIQPPAPLSCPETTCPCLFLARK